MRDVGYPMSTSMDFWRACVCFSQVENIREDPWYGTLARYVRKLHLVHSITVNASIILHAPLRRYSPSLACKSEPEVDLYGVSAVFPHLPSPSQARASQRCIFGTVPDTCVLLSRRRVFSPSLCPSRAAGDVSTPSLPPPPFLTSQDCTAVSIDTRTALARFIGWFWEDTREWVWVLPGF